MAAAGWKRLESKPLVLALLLLPAAWIGWRTASGDLGANPVETLEHATGDWALRFLLITLAISPLVSLSGWNWPRRVRRMLGLAAFGYACVHLLLWSGLDMSFDPGEIAADIAKRRYVLAGMTGFLCMVPLAATSSNWAIRKLGPDRWRLLHRLIYVAASAAVIHYWWLVKKDHTKPEIYAALAALLLGWRIVRAVRGRRAKPAAPATIRAV